MANDEERDRSLPSSGSAGTDEGAGGESDGASTVSQRTETVLLNSLDGLVSDRRSILEDEESARLLRDAYRAVTTPSTRTSIESVLERLAAGSEEPNGSGSGEETATESLAAVLADIAGELAARGARIQIDHDVSLTLSPTLVAVHRFFHTRDPADLHPLMAGEVNIPTLERAATAAEAGDFETAAVEFATAVDERSDTETAIAVRTLSAWAHHRAGDDESAVAAVRDVLRHDQDAWPARLVGVAAAHSNPEWFRDGRLSSEAYVRVRTELSDDASLDVAVVDADGTERWLEGSPACFIAQELPADGALRLRLSGPPGQLPPLHAYYLAVGVVEPGSAQSRSVEQILLDGPLTADPTERVHIRTQ
jgi:hypothetical protein